MLQETFLEAWRNATRYNPERADLAGWLVTIARSRAVDRLREGGEGTGNDAPHPAGMSGFDAL